MSLDMYVWYEPYPISTAEALTKMVAYQAGNMDVFLAHPSVHAFYTDLLTAYPHDSLVWSAPPVESDRFVFVLVMYSRGEALFTAGELADLHGLVCFDPQSDQVFLPPAMKPRT